MSSSSSSRSLTAAFKLRHVALLDGIVARGILQVGDPGRQFRDRSPIVVEIGLPVGEEIAALARYGPGDHHAEPVDAVLDFQGMLHAPGRTLL